MEFLSSVEERALLLHFLPTRRAVRNGRMHYAPLTEVRVKARQDRMGARFVQTNDARGNCRDGSSSDRGSSDRRSSGASSSNRSSSGSDGGGPRRRRARTARTNAARPRRRTVTVRPAASVPSGVGRGALQTHLLLRTFADDLEDVSIGVDQWFEAFPEKYLRFPLFSVQSHPGMDHLVAQDLSAQSLQELREARSEIARTGATSSAGFAH